ncbi:MAG: hypothetical protein OEM59_02360 [Rhodospirillales bacterium]|nr:hypothetical protein [Rhodospirillales bacterium]
MELLIRSIARAGGIEVSPEVTVMASPPRQKTHEVALREVLARGFHGLARLLDRLGDRVAAAAANRGPAVPAT